VEAHQPSDAATLRTRALHQRTGSVVLSLSSLAKSHASHVWSHPLRQSRALTPTALAYLVSHHHSRESPLPTVRGTITDGAPAPSSTGGAGMPAELIKAQLLRLLLALALLREMCLLGLLREARALGLLLAPVHLGTMASLGLFGLRAAALLGNAAALSLLRLELQVLRLQGIELAALRLFGRLPLPLGLLGLLPRRSASSCARLSSSARRASSVSRA
jgi:hypothetical protein